MGEEVYKDEEVHHPRKTRRQLKSEPRRIDKDGHPEKAHRKRGHGIDLDGAHHYCNACCIELGDACPVSVCTFTPIGEDTTKEVPHTRRGERVSTALGELAPIQS